MESASFRAAALRVPTADPPDPGSLPLRQELAQLRAEGLRGELGQVRPGAPGCENGRCWPPSPAEAGATRSGRGRYMYSGDILLVDRPRGRYKPTAGLILSIGRESPRKPRLMTTPRCRARPYPRGPSRRRSRLYMSPTEAARGRASSGPCRRSVGSRVVQMEGAGGAMSLKFYSSSSNVGSHDPALAPRASGRGPGHPRGPASASGTSRARSSTTLGCRRHLADIWPPTMDDDDAACTRTWRAPRRPTAEEIAAVHDPHRPGRLRLPHGPWRWNESRPGLPAGYFETVHVATSARAATAAARPVEV